MTNAKQIDGGRRQKKARLIATKLGSRAEVPMSDLLEILKLAKETVASLVGRRRVAAEKSWDDVVLALDKLSELSNHHVKAVAS